jgi:hypothetical protein
MPGVHEAEASKRLYAEGSAPSTPAAGLVETYAKTDGLLYSKDDAGLETLMSAGADGLTTDTEFPGGPSTGDRLRRSDLDYQVFFYDGTRWVTEVIFSVTGEGWGIVITQDAFGSVVFDETGLDAWLVDWEVGISVIDTQHDGTHFWAISLYDIDANASGGVGTLIVNLDSDDVSTGLNNFASAKVAIDAVLDVSTDPGVRFVAIKTSSPGTARLVARLTYRMIAT